MFSLLFHQILALALPRARKPQAPPSDDSSRLWNWLEANGEIVFPLLGLAIAALLFLGIRRGMESSTEQMREKEERKEAIVRMMRAKLMVSAEMVAADLQVDKFLAASLLDELVREGKLVEQRMTGGIANYRLKGL
jgi:hypothetical protein